MTDDNPTFEEMLAADPTRDALRALTTPLVHTWGAGQRITVDDLLRNPARVARGLADVDHARRLMLAAFPPGPPLPRWQRVRNRARNRIARGREAIALRIAPWLEP